MQSLFFISVLKKLGSEFKMHCVIMIPLSAPDKSVFFENFHNFKRNTV